MRPPAFGNSANKEMSGSRLASASPANCFEVLNARGDCNTIPASTPLVVAVSRARSIAEFPKSGGLIAYGPNLIELFRRCGNYVAKILHGAKPSELPIQRPERFDLVINLKTAAALGLDVPSQLQQLADEVIE